jgi:DNA-binding MarR family transcriptional regulator
MNALPNNVVAFELPKKPRIKQKDAPPDQRKVCVLPIRAITDQAITDNMLRILAVLCSYCNRAGLTWVSQKKLAEDMKVSRQAITKQLGKLTAAGYVEVVRKGFRGERSNTVRVIFDPTVKAEDAIAITSSLEDTRPPVIKQEQAMEAEEIDRAGQAKIAQMLAKGLAKTFNQPKERTMPKEGDTLAVKKMKEDIQKAKRKRTPLATTEVANVTAQEVANEELHRQPHRQPNRVAQNSEEHSNRETYKSKNIKEDINKSIVMATEQVEMLKSQGLTDQDITEGLDILTAAYKAEGLTPKSQQLVEGLLQMHKDAR